MTHQEIGIYEINRISYLGKGYMYWVDSKRQVICWIENHFKKIDNYIEN